MSHPETLPVARYRFEIQFNAPLQLNWYGGSMLRGSFGHALRQISCMTREAECDGCLLQQGCPYPHIFQPIANLATQKSWSGRFGNIPPPYVIEAPLPGMRYLQPGESLCFNMVLIGQAAIKQLSLLIFAWQRAFQRGITPQRVVGELVRVSYLAEALEEEGVTLFAPSEGMITLDKPEPPLSAMRPDNERYRSEGGRLSLLTPLRIKIDGRVQGQELSAERLLTTLLRRYWLLCQLYGTSPTLEPSFPVREEMAKIETVTHLQHYDWCRYSNRQQRRMNLGGMMGEIELRGELGPWYELLHLGQWLHIGGQTSFGLGGYRLAPL
ncbi:CRISPR system precrRNA processing endoribonuclease RAMP protein Cas6 [Ectothiorhodospiraceae bacterium BW-2]|nr:CRISPR system precrRNA processing endoribonuclease RAMP protein Cas6 [Ectothiorhodospiraceae bacterium BW-2]